MEYILFLGGLILSLIAISLIHILLTYKTHNSTGAPLPPGNVGFPLVGESIEFLSHLKLGRSENFVFNRMAKHCHQVFKTSIIAEPVAIMCGSAGSRFLFTNDDKLVKQWWPLGVNTLLAPCRRNPFPFKNIILMFYRGDHLKKQVGIIDRLAQRHLETDWQGRQEVTVLQLAKKYAFSVACHLALSIEDEELIKKLQDQVSTIILGFLKLKINLPGTAYNRAFKAWNATRKLLSEIVAERRKEMLQSQREKPSTSSSHFQDTLSNLLAAITESAEEMSDMEIADRLIGVLIVIHDTTSVIITMIFKYLATHPDVYEAVLHENMDLAAKKNPGEVLNWDDIQRMHNSWNVTREVLRLCPPAQAIFREAITDFVYAGYHIPKGWKLLLSIKATHMDPKYFVEPEKFDPSRFEGDGPLPNTYMPFGGGLNICPGKNFAPVLILIFIHNAVRRFKWELTLDSDEQMLIGPLPRPTSGIPVRLYPHADQTQM